MAESFAEQFKPRCNTYVTVGIMGKNDGGTRLKDILEGRINYADCHGSSRSVSMVDVYADFRTPYTFDDVALVRKDVEITIPEKCTVQKETLRKIIDYYPNYDIAVDMGAMGSLRLERPQVLFAVDVCLKGTERIMIHIVESNIIIMNPSTIMPLGDYK